ncbi:MAG: hypothetical protein ABIN67_12905 [Ferruginibacter sp.]
MAWIKKGIIYMPDGSNALMHSHAAIPYIDKITPGRLRIYFSSRNKEGKSLPFSIDVNAKNLQEIYTINDFPILELGKLGTFDDCGIMPSCIVTYGNKKYMYYIGWNPQVTVSYRLSIGLAISEDGGGTFLKHSNGPILDRDINEPYFNTAPFVLLENGIWRMWYISCTEWIIINNHPEPKYHIKYCESGDGINWNKKGIVCIDYDADAEAIGRPTVFFENGIYKMYYSYRKIADYRTNRDKAYRLGYAESFDGIVWEKMNELVGIKMSANVSDWDHQMIAYCHVLVLEDKKLMIYNGNGFGKSGIGYAIYE